MPLRFPPHPFRALPPQGPAACDSPAGPGPAVSGDTLLPWRAAAQPRGEGLPRLARHRPGCGHVAGPGLRAPGTACGRFLESQGFSRERLANSGLFTGAGERFAGMVVVPEVAGGRVRWLAGRAIDRERSPRFQALPGPKPVLGLGRLGPTPPWAIVTEGLFDWLVLAQWGLPACAALGTQGLERVVGSAPRLPQGLPRLRQRRGGTRGHGAPRGLAWPPRRSPDPARSRLRRGRAGGHVPRTGRLRAPAHRGGASRRLATSSVFAGLVRPDPYRGRAGSCCPLHHVTQPDRRRSHDRYPPGLAPPTGLRIPETRSNVTTPRRRTR